MFDASLLQDFITESEEHLEEMENYLLKLEGDTDNREILNDIFRCVHTIKGAAEFVGLEKVSDFTHRLENLLDILRQGSGDLTAEIVDLFIDAKDRIGRLLKDLEVHATENTPIDDLCVQVDDWISRFSPETASAEEPGSSAAPTDLKTDFLDEEEPAVPELLGDAELQQAPETDTETPAEQGRHPGPPAAEATRQRDTATAAGQDSFNPMFHAGEIPELDREEIDDEDNDRELFEIFLQQVKQKVTEIAAGADDIAHGDPIQGCDRIHEALGLLKSSVNYMGYLKLQRFLDAWLSITEAVRSRAREGAAVSSDVMRPFIARIIAHFPRIAFDIPAQYREGADLSESAAAVPVDPTAGGDNRDAGSEEDQSLLSKLENAFDLFDAASENEGPALRGTPQPPAAEEVPPTASEKTQPTAAASDPSGNAADVGDGQAFTAMPVPAEDETRPGARKGDPDTAAEREAFSAAVDAAFELTEADLTASADISEEPSRSELPADAELSPAAAGKKNMRVDTEKIDALMNQVGELVVSRSWFSQLVHEMHELHQDLKESTATESMELKKIKGLAIKINEATSVLGRVVNDLQDGVMKIRMLPISQLFNRYPRLIRDLVQNTGKKVRLDIRGESTELDKMIIEQMSDPLIHIIRNAVDHGIETIAERKRLGKPEEGTLALIAYHESNHVVIEIVDDGRGIDPERVRAAALQRDFLPRDELERMTPKELIGLIMRPGFSTAAAVTHTSGRGVGMDVVKKNIEKLNGTIEIDSRAGLETRLKIKIPLTLAIISALLVNVGQKSFAIPLSAVEETLRIFREQISTVEGFEVIHLRNRTLPLLQLSEMFDIETVMPADQKAYVVMVSSGARRVGLLVDTLIGQEEVVIKPLADYIQEDSAFSGATILGDGKISLILDVDGLVNLAVRKHSLSRTAAVGFEMPETGAEPPPEPPPPGMTLQ